MQKTEIDLQQAQPVPQPVPMTKSSSQFFVRKDWISACLFKNATEQEVWVEIFRRLEQEAHPVVVLDLDSTLYDLHLRNHQIFLEWSQSSESQPFPIVRKVISEVNADLLGYSVKDTFECL